MTTIESLKDQARRHEKKEEWQKALDLYGKAITKLDQVESPDIGLFNRVGDLSTRIGRSDAAVDHYERAVELYLEAELPNNAIAVCKKIIRNLPNRHSVFLRMGQIRADQGFLVDARNNFLTYAERVQGEGDLDEALRALTEFADLAPGDTGIRVALAEQYAANERPAEAIAQLAHAWAVLTENGDVEGATALEAKAAEIDPSANLADAHPVRTADDGDAFGFESTALGGDAFGDGQEVQAAFGEPDESAPATAVPPSPGSAAPGAIEATAEEATADSDEDEWENDDEDLGGELPLMTFDDDEDQGEVDDDARAPIATGLDEFSLDDFGGDEGEEDNRVELFEELARQAADAPGDLRLAQRMVEAAYRIGDDPVMVRAYLALAQSLQTTGDPSRARGVFQQVLELDPENAEARAGLEASGGVRREVQEVAAQEDYVDLGSLILGDEDEKTTRFKVAYEEPSGDEAADFRKMLSQFKAKVAENFDAADMRAHHDLGTAYKEMGLLDEAIEEFQKALRANPDHLASYELLGQVFMEKGEMAAAVNTLDRALGVGCDVEDDLIGIYYYLGRAHEELDQSSAAVDFYDKVFALDINFADVTERLRALR
ncbi:MAG: tetratricopeptide repeat protein [Longimicrobiales bacterium]|nr:tetratricopeptide repeat protein [Longimicrobiales bacterium]